MRLAIAFIFIASVLGCTPEAQVVETPIMASVLTRKIFLKDVTTGQRLDEKSTKRLRTRWSFFGAERGVIVQQTSDGVVTSVKFDVGSSSDGAELQSELEKKFSQENGTKVLFNCNYEDKRVSLLDNMPTTQKLCTLTSGSQVLSLKHVYTRDAQAEVKFPNAKVLYDSTEVQLVDTELESARIASDEKAYSDAMQRKRSSAKNDL